MQAADLKCTLVSAAGNRGLCPKRKNHQLGWWIIICIKFNIFYIIINGDKVNDEKNLPVAPIIALSISTIILFAAIIYLIVKIILLFI